MYFAVSKITFDDDAFTGHDAKDLKSLVERIRQRFKVSVLGKFDEHHSSTLAIAVAVLGMTQDQVTHTMDAIVQFCESSGFGRVSDEITLMDDIDNLADDYVPDS